MINKKKKGSIFIWTYIFLAIIIVFSAFFLYITNTHNTYQEVEEMVETIGKTRVQATDIPLKEQFGYIEIIHSGYDPEFGGYYSPSTYEPEKLFIENDGSPIETPGYTNTILPKDDPSYLEAVRIADKTAIQTGLISLSHRIKEYDVELNYDGNTGDYNAEVITSERSHLDINESNICIKVFPLPYDDNPTTEVEKMTIDIECTTPNGDTISARVNVNGVDNPLNKRDSPLNIGGESPEYKNLKIYNAVFVATSFDNRKSVLFRALKSFTGSDVCGPGETADDDCIIAPKKQFYKILYPQIDADTFNHSGWN